MSEQTTNNLKTRRCVYSGGRHGVCRLLRFGAGDFDLALSAFGVSHSGRAKTLFRLHQRFRAHRRFVAHIAFRSAAVSLRDLGDKHFDRTCHADI